MTKPVRTWPVPIAVGLISAIGLLAALLADGVWNAVSWMALAVPVVLIGWHGLPRRKRQ